MSPESPLNSWWFSTYEKRYDVYPVQAAYRMSQALLGLKLAVEKALAANGGKKPNSEQLAAALKGLEWQSPGGTIKMVNGKGHQAIQEMVYGQFKLEGGKPVITHVVRYPAECVNPPDGTTSKKWIESGFPGAKCK